jgi:hypothetical protein
MIIAHNNILALTILDQGLMGFSYPHLSFEGFMARLKLGSLYS